MVVLGSPTKDCSRFYLFLFVSRAPAIQRRIFSLAKAKGKANGLINSLFYVVKALPRSFIWIRWQNVYSLVLHL